MLTTDLSTVLIMSSFRDSSKHWPKYSRVFEIQLSKEPLECFQPVCVCIYVCVSVHFTSLLSPSRGGRMQVLNSESKIDWANFTDWMLTFAAKLDGTPIVAM